MISVIIPTLNASAGLAATLAALVPGLVSGVLREVVLVDGGSIDNTLEIAEVAGVKIVQSKCGRGSQLRKGAQTAKSDWLLFLHADTVLEAGWDEEVRVLIERIEFKGYAETAAAFRFVLDDSGFLPRMIERGVALRCAVLRMPYGDQGLLIPRRLYDKIGGYSDIPLLEDVDLNRRIGRTRMHIMRSGAVTSAIRYRRDGYIRRILRNWVCLSMYYCRVPVANIARIYN